jgi:hypothetical protein
MTIPVASNPIINLGIVPILIRTNTNTNTNADIHIHIHILVCFISIILITGRRGCW